MKGSRSSRSLRSSASRSAALLGAAALSFALAGPADAGAPPEEVRLQIEALSSDRYERREEATEALRRIGEPARPALEEAAKSADPEVRFRALAVLKDLDARPRRAAPRPGESGESAPPEQGMAGLQVESVSVQEGPDGIRVAVATHRDGRKEEQVYEAPSREEFRKRHPEIYGKYLEGGASRVLYLRDFLVPAPRLQLRDLDEEFERMRKGMPEGRLLEIGPGPARRARLGVTFDELPEPLALHLKLEGGALLTSVVPGSPADEGGLRAQDIVLRLGGSAIRSTGDLVEAVRAAPEGKPCRVEGIREGKPFAVEVRLAEPSGEEGK